MFRSQITASEQVQCAKKIARLHISRFKKYKPGFKYPKISTVYPMRDPSGKDGILFEVKLVSRGGKDNGYAIISLSRDFIPVLSFSFEGCCITESLQKVLGNWDFVPVFYTPLYVAAEDEKGGYLGSIGLPPTDDAKPSNTHENSKKNGEVNYDSFKKYFQLKRAAFLKNKSELADQAWKKILKKGTGGGTKSQETLESDDYIRPENLPETAFQIASIYKNTTLPRYVQIAPGIGENVDNDFYSGCGACAWMGLIGYHDRYWTTDLLRGTDITNAGYTDRIMVQLSKSLHTYRSDALVSQGGGVDRSDMSRAYDFISAYLRHPVNEPKYDYDVDSMAALQIVYDNLMVYKMPSVISVPGHYLNAYEVCEDDSGEDKDYYLRVYKGGGLPPEYDPYIHYGWLDSAWTFKDISPRLQVLHSLPEQPQSLAPVVTTPFGSRLILTYRDMDKSIRTMYSDDGINAVANQGIRIPSIAYSRPSAVVDSGKYLYIAFSNGSKFKLVKIDVRTDRIYDLPTPKPPLSDHDTPPAIAILKGKLFFLWKSKREYAGFNLLSCPLDELERNETPWPREITDNWPNGSFWKILPGKIYSDLSITSDDSMFYLGYKRRVKSGEVSEEYVREGENYFPVISEITMIDENGTKRSSINGRGSILTDVQSAKYFLPDGRIWNPFSIIYSFNTLNSGVYITIPKHPGANSYLFSDQMFKEPYFYLKIGQNRGISLGSYNNVSVNGTGIGNCLLSAWVGDDRCVNVRYHSVDCLVAPMDDAGWPLGNTAWPY